MMLAVITGVLAGSAIGYVLQRGQLCFHSMFAEAWSGRGFLLRGWLLGVAIASVGLSLLYLTSWSHGLNTGLAFQPVSNIAGGLIIGVGMVIASTCVSGLFYKLGSGMAGASVGLAGWIAGELVARRVQLPGPTELSGGNTATFAAVLGLPRLACSIGFLLIVVVALSRWRGKQRPWQRRQWNWPTLGIALGLVTVAGWVLARIGGSSFGPSTVGASASVAAGSPDWWLIAFLAGIVIGGFVAARTSGGWSLRRESTVRYGRLAVGGFLLGGGGWIAGGCNLGHGLSGAAQLNVSSWVVVASMATGVCVAIAVTRTTTWMRTARSPTTTEA